MPWYRKKTPQELGQEIIALAKDDDNLDAIKDLITKGASLAEKASWNNHTTALARAVYNGSLKVAQLLIDSGGFVDERDPLLINAIDNKNEAMVELLLSRGAKIDRQRYDGRTALHHAFYRGELAIARRLIKAGADVRIKDNNDKTPLLCAITSRAGKDIVQMLLDAGAMDNKNDFELFSTAIGYGNVEIVETLIAGGATVDQRSGTDGQTLLMVAVDRWSVEMITLLLKNGAPIEAVDADGMTALMHSIYGHRTLAVTQALLDARARIDAVTADGRSVMHCAVEHHLSPQDIGYLVQAGADIDHQDERGITPLMQAVKNRNEKMVLALLRRGANVHLADKEGKTARRHAQELEQEIIESLLLSAVFKTPDGFKLKDQTAVVRTRGLAKGIVLSERFDFAARKITTVAEKAGRLTPVIERFETVSDKTEIINAYQAYLKLGGSEIDWQSDVVVPKTKVPLEFKMPEDRTC